MLANREILSVSELTEAARRLLEDAFPLVFVSGEISNFTSPRSGHWYFTLKDDRSQLGCAMFKNRNQLIRFTPQNGMQVIVRGKVSLYVGRGDFQMIAEFIEAAGDGALRQAFEKLKLELAAEGLFAEDSKQTLPTLPAHLAIITSPTGAAVRDVLHVLRRRFQAIAVSIIPVQVQGEGSVEQIVQAIAFANQYKAQPFTALLLARGGGSLEDLWAFNTEPVARAIYASQIPIVSAIGHETDVTIADFVADVRAPTPSAAAEILSPDKIAWQQQLQDLRARLVHASQQQTVRLKANVEHLFLRLRHPGERCLELHQRLDHLETRLTMASRHYLKSLAFEPLQLRLKMALDQQLQAYRYRLSNLSNQLDDPRIYLAKLQSQLRQHQQKLIHQITLTINQAKHQLATLTKHLDALSPLAVLQRGYALAYRVDTSEVLKTTQQLTPGDKVRTQLGQGSFIAEITDIRSKSG